MVLSILFTAWVGIAAPAWDSYLHLVSRKDPFGIAAICGGTAIGTLLVIIALRELRSVTRLRRIEGVRRLAQSLRDQDNGQDQTARNKAASRILRGVIALYADRSHSGVKVDSLVALRRRKTESADVVLKSIETNALAPLDDEALRIVRRASVRIGTFTAVSPWGALDMLIVAYMNLSMIRALAQHYNARPGLVSTVKMALGYSAGLAASGALGVAAPSLAEHMSKWIGAGVVGGFAKGTANATATALLGSFVVSAVRPVPFEEGKGLGLLKVVFPPDGFVARTIERMAQVKNTAVVAVQGLGRIGLIGKPSEASATSPAVTKPNSISRRLRKLR